MIVKKKSNLKFFIFIRKIGLFVIRRASYKSFCFTMMVHCIAFYWVFWQKLGTSLPCHCHFNIGVIKKRERKSTSIKLRSQIACSRVEAPVLTGDINTIVHSRESWSRAMIILSDKLKLVLSCTIARQSLLQCYFPGKRSCTMQGFVETVSYYCSLAASSFSIVFFSTRNQ